MNTVADELVQYQVEKGIPNVLNGYTEFDFEKVANMVLFFSRVGINKTKLMKCLFYADFLFHKRYTNSISGLKYKKLQYGPVPERHGTLLERIEERNFISVENTLNGEFVQIIVKANEELNPELFNDCELEVLEVVAKKFGDFDSCEISEFSQKEKGWIETSNSDFISYAFSESLQLD